MGADYKHADKLLVQTATYSTLAANTTIFLNSARGHFGEANAEFRSPESGVIERLFCHAGTPPGAGETFTYMVRVNGADSVVTCQTAGAVVNESEDIVNGFPVVAGDTICVRVITSLNAAAAFHTATFIIRH